MRKTKELDHHLKHIINNVPINLEKFIDSMEENNNAKIQINNVVGMVL